MILVASQQWNGSRVLSWRHLPIRKSRVIECEWWHNRHHGRLRCQESGFESCYLKNTGYFCYVHSTHIMQLHNSPECKVQIPQHDNHTSSTEWWFYEKKSLAGMEIWTHNLVAHLFLPGHYLPYRDLHLSHISIGPYLHQMLRWSQ